jgi:hypothetical protein
MLAVAEIEGEDDEVAVTVVNPSLIAVTRPFEMLAICGFDEAHITLVLAPAGWALTVSVCVCPTLIETEEGFKERLTGSITSPRSFSAPAPL